MKAQHLLLWLCLGFLYQLQAQPLPSPQPLGETFTVSGYVKDGQTGEELLYAQISDYASNGGTTTNLYGFYSITLEKGIKRLEFSYVGYQSLVKEINLNKDIELNIYLEPASATLKEVVVSGESENASVEDLSISRIEVDVEQVKKLPALLGEPDVIKTIQTLPGVTTAGEGTSAFFVRGGSADQNLILIDEAPVYEISHLFGLFSVFNPDIIKNAELYKGGIPAKYGGRLSSLLEVTTRDGNARRLSGSGGIGLLAAKLSVEGPVVEDEMSFILSGRRSYADIFMRNSAEFDGTTVQFYDLNAKLNWKKDNKNRFFLSAYSGRDIWNFDDNFKMDWGNTTTTFRWNHLFSDRMFSNLSLIYSNFAYFLEDSDQADGFRWEASQREVSLKKDITCFVNPSWTVQFGYQGIYRRFSPAKISPHSSESIFKEAELEKHFALDHALYIGSEYEVSERLSIQGGLRFSLFQNIGESTVYQYTDPKDNINVEVVDSLKYGSFENIKTYSNVEPRFSARYLLDPTSSVKLSYNRMVQYVHLITNSTVPIPFNTWAPSSPYLEPQKADQIAVGYFKNFNKGTYEFSAEAFYKKSQDITAFADNANLVFNPHLSTEFRQGSGEAYGLELFLQKTKGKMRGFVSYTLSKSEVEIPTVNNDQPFPANHDRRHNLNLALTYQLSDKWNVGSNFTYGTGRPITLPTGKFVFDDYVVNYYSSRNGYRLPDFHRMDLSATYEPGKNKDKQFKNVWTFGIYNVYNRKNPFIIYTQKKQDDDGNIIGDGTETEARLVYLFGALPYFSWNFSF